MELPRLSATHNRKRDKHAQTPTYEEDYNELEEIVKAIETESVSVDVLAEKVKRAAELIAYCQTKLSETETEVTRSSPRWTPTGTRPHKNN